MSLIIDKVETFLQKCEYHPIRSGENEIIVKGLSGLNDDTAVSFNIRVWGDDVYDPCPGDDGRYVFPAHLIAESKFPITVPSNKRNKMVSLFNKINLEADVAWVALNMESERFVANVSYDQFLLTHLMMISWDHGFTLRGKNSMHYIH